MCFWWWRGRDPDRDGRAVCQSTVLVIMHTHTVASSTTEIVDRRAQWSPCSWKSTFGFQPFVSTHFCTCNSTFCTLLRRIGMRPLDGWSAFRALLLLRRSFDLGYMFVCLSVFLSFFLSSITFHAFIYFVGILQFCYKYSLSSWLKQMFDIQNIFACLSWFYGYQLITNIETLLGNFNSCATPHRGHYVTNCTSVCAYTWLTVPVSVLIRD